MPEGPEIKRAADRIAAAIVAQPLTGVFFAFEALKSYEPMLTQTQVSAVQPRGKALLIRFQNQFSIYSHNQLYGRWYVRSARSYPATNRQLRLAIHTPRKSALLYSASDIAVLSADEVAAHPFLRRLGPDLLDPDTSLIQVLEQVQAGRFQRRRLAGLLLDQSFLGGLGNYLRSEVLFVARIPPTHRPIDCTPDQIAGLAQAALALSQQSYQTHGITNDLAIAARLKQQGLPRRTYRHWVFGRDACPCHRCATAIIKTTAANRRLYYCPHCQSH